VDYVHALPWAGLRLKGFAEYNVRGESFAGPENLTRQALDGRRLLNLRVGLTPDDARWTIEAWVRNALDDDYTVNRDRDFFGTLIRERGDPRTAGLTLRAEW
jgi:outer membrane receptor protein involved in Fe transport